MVTVNYETSPKYKTFRLSVTGHAGQAEVGKDLVCACVSILTYTAAHNVEFLAGVGAYAQPPAIKLNEGDSHIECKVTEQSLYKNLANRLDAVVTGFRLLQASYPQYVAFNFNGKAEKPNI
jgi:uncharacterized protein YsxB (DUF464 family)